MVGSHWNEKALKPVKQLINIFSKFSLLYEIVTDNGTACTSHKFKMFLNNTNIIYKTEAAFHRASNGAKVSAVKTIKTL